MIPVGLNKICGIIWHKCQGSHEMLGFSLCEEKCGSFRDLMLCPSLLALRNNQDPECGLR